MSMPDVNFFSPEYVTEDLRSDTCFGLCDDGHCAYSTTSGIESDWGAVVKNNDSVPIMFIPIDHNIVIHDSQGNELSMCDGMLYTEDNSFISFVELKSANSEWASEAKGQLESTLTVFQANCDYTLFKKRFAYASNKKHPIFNYSRKQEMQSFWNKYRFRLLFQREIVVVK